MPLELSAKSERRDAIPYLQGHAISPTTSVVDADMNNAHSDQSSENLLAEQSLSRSMTSRSNTIEGFIGVANAHTPKSSPGATQISTSCDIRPCNDEATRTQSTDQGTDHLETAVKEFEEEQGQVTFRDPFKNLHQGREEFGTGSSSDSPGTVS